MQDISTPLDDSELERLDEFLLERIDEDVDTEGKDEGVLDVSELDGLFTAIVSSPVSILPSQWLPAVWGDFTPLWQNQKEFESIFSMMVRHMNGIVATLMQEPESFEPLFQEREVKGKTYPIVDEWCEGYRRGVALTAEQWKAGGAHMNMLLDPIFAFTGATQWRAHDLADEEERDRIRDTIAPRVRQIHAYWLERRSADIAAISPQRRKGSNVGRNDPCPCGSGRKFKHCCLH